MPSWPIKIKSTEFNNTINVNFILNIFSTFSFIRLKKVKVILKLYFKCPSSVWYFGFCFQSWILQRCQDRPSSSLVSSLSGLGWGHWKFGRKAPSYNFIKSIKGNSAGKDWRKKDYFIQTVSAGKKGPLGEGPFHTQLALNNSGVGVLTLQRKIRVWLPALLVRGFFTPDQPRITDIVVFTTGKKKNLRVGGPTQFIPVLLKAQLYIPFPDFKIIRWEECVFSKITLNFKKANNDCPLLIQSIRHFLYIK